MLRNSGYRDKLWVTVIGASRLSPEEYSQALEIGRILGEQGFVVLTGGLGGTMEAVARGAKESGALTIGVLPTRSRGDANPWIDIPIPTGIGEHRNLILINSGDVVISLFKGYGTLIELAYAMKLEKRIIGYKTWEEVLRGYKYSSICEDLGDLRELLLQIKSYY